MAKNGCCGWDFTLKDTGQTIDEIKASLKQYCKKWTFQKEKGEKTGYLHYQGRVSLKLKTRKPPFWQKDCKWTPTSNENVDNNFYVSKEDTRIGLTYSDTDKEVYIPRQFRNIILYTWQKLVIDSSYIFNDRKIDLIYDPKGNSGKSTVAAICELLHNGIDMPPINDFKELIATLCCILSDENQRSPNIIFFDLPRALDKERLYGLYSAIEQVKKGKVFDQRYHYKKWWFDSPRIWVFSNHLPDMAILSADRWNIWTINNETKNLDRFEGGKPVTIQNDPIEYGL